jgi:hypothetical protein
VTHQDGRWPITDLGTANGSLLDGAPMPANRPLPRSNGDSGSWATVMPLDA